MFTKMEDRKELLSASEWVSSVWEKIYPDKSEFEKAYKDTPGLRGLTYADAIKEALIQTMEEDSNVFVMGEGVDDPGGIFGTTLGLQERFGKERVFDIPIAENAMTGVAIGASLAGMRPVFVHMRMDFLLCAMDQLVNHAAKWHYMFGGCVSVPIVVRTLIGRGWGSAAQHSQSLQGLFMHTPGLKVVMPTTPYDVKGLLLSSIKDPDPVIFIEHRWLYKTFGYVPQEPYKIPLGEGIIRKEGEDITIVAISHMVLEAMEACKVLEKEGIYAELIDPRTIKPMDWEMIFNSVKKTGRLLIADTGYKSGGVGAEISAKVIENVFPFLKAPIVRVATADTPTPASHILEKAFYPSSKDVLKAAKEALSYR
jgi:pyruvate dehydrogenase E1 component beta subunit